MAQWSSPSKRTSNGTRPTVKAGSPRHAIARIQGLAALLPLWEHEIKDISLPGRLRVLAKLRRALRIERQHGVSGHWSYNLARHKALLDAYRREAQLLRRDKAHLPTYTRSKKSKS